MTHSTLRRTFSLVFRDNHYFVQCDETKELVTAGMSSRDKAMRRLREFFDVDQFIESLDGISKEEVERRVNLYHGRLRPYRMPWTIEEARLVASLYSTRGQLYNENQKFYAAAYGKGWLDQICQHMKPSRKKHKFVISTLNPNVAFAKIFDYPSHFDFSRAEAGAYDALRRFGVDTVELFENRNDATYLQKIIRQLAQEAVEKSVA